MAHNSSAYGQLSFIAVSGNFLNNVFTNNEFGIEVSQSDSFYSKTYLRDNIISDNKYGTWLTGEAILVNNHICNNQEFDVFSVTSNVLGVNNTCGYIPSTYNRYTNNFTGDVGYNNCTFTCGGLRSQENKTNVCYCSSCADCTSALENDACTYIILTSNISSSDTCIDPVVFDRTSPVVFDCEGHKIFWYWLRCWYFL